MNKIFLEVIIAPDFTAEALEILQKKANLRLLKLAPAQDSGLIGKSRRRFLVQEGDTVDLEQGKLKVVTKREPTEAEWDDLFFGWKVVKYVKSNAIVFCKDRQLIGVGAGQMNRVQSVRLAAEQAGAKAKGQYLLLMRFSHLLIILRKQQQAALRQLFNQVVRLGSRGD